MADFKNNHYVPEMLLKRFMNDKEAFYYYDMRKPNKAIQHRNPSSVFCENNLYVDIDKSGKRDVSLENEVYSKLDNDANQVIEKIIVAARQSQLPQLSIEEKTIWDQFLFHQWQRTPDARIEIEKTLNFEDEYSNSIAQFEKVVRPLNPYEKIIWHGSLKKEKVRKTSHIMNLKMKHEMPVQALGSKGLGIAKIKNQKNSFIIGSFPVVRLSYDGKTLADPTTEVWLPIAHDIIVTPSGKKHEEKLVELDGTKVRKMNELVCRQSSEIAGRSPELLRSLLRGT
jgi:hypothetical protein